MKKMLACFAFASVLMISSASAQDYNGAVGIRIDGEMAGISGKYFFNPSNAVEVALSTRYDKGVNVLGLYEHHIPVLFDGFSVCCGFGGHTGSWWIKNERKFVIGVDGVAGVEYKINNSPIALSVDYKPYFNFSGSAGFHWSGLSIGAKVTF